MLFSLFLSVLIYQFVCSFRLRNVLFLCFFFLCSDTVKLILLNLNRFVQMTGKESRGTHINAVTKCHLLPWAVVSTSEQPAVPGLLDQHSNYLSPGEGQQGGVGASRLMGHPGPHDPPSTTTSCWVCSEAQNTSLWRRGCRDDKWNTEVQREQSW